MRIEPLRFDGNLMTFEESTNHLNRHPSITFAFDCYYRLSRGKKRRRRRRRQSLLDDERETRSRKKKRKHKSDQENGHSKIYDALSALF